MVEEGRRYAGIADNVNVKLPMCIESLKAARVLSREGIDVNMTLIFSTQQALMAAKAGAAYVSPFVGRLDDIGARGSEMLAETVNVLRGYGLGTRVIAASIRHPLHVLEAADAGCDIATIPFDILKMMVKHPKTDEGIAKFRADYEKVNGKQ